MNKRKINLLVFEGEETPPSPQSVVDNKTTNNDKITITRDELNKIIDDEVTKIISTQTQTITDKLSKVEQHMKLIGDTIISDNKPAKKDINFTSAFGLPEKK